MSVRGIWSPAIALPALLACFTGCQAADQPPPPIREEPAKATAVPSPDRRAELTLAEPRLPWPVAAGAADAAAIRHIEIVIDAIDNPRLIPLRFRVYAPDPSGGERLLGSFANYPPDRPGRFLIQVPAQVRLGDEIVLALAPAAEVSADDTVRVGIAEVRFLPAADRSGDN